MGVEKVVTMGIGHGVQVNIYAQWGENQPGAPLVIEKPAAVPAAVPNAGPGASSSVTGDGYVMQLSHGVQLSVPGTESSSGAVAYVMQLSHGVQLRVYS